MSNELEYIDDIDDNGFPTSPTQTHRPKYLTATTALQKRLLKAGRRDYFRPGEKSQVIMIEKAMMSLVNDRALSVYPTEWVEHCVSLWERENAVRLKRVFENLLKYMQNKDAKTEWISRYLERYQIQLGEADREEEDYTSE